MPVLATVRNTGSHTAHNILSRYHMHFLTEDRQMEPILWFGHCEPGNLALIDKRMQTDPPLILTMRHPIAVWKSWKRRRKPPDRTFTAMWSNLFALKSLYLDSFWLPVDTDDRDIYLGKIESRLGVPLNHDFTRKGVYQTAYECDDGLSENEALKFFSRFPFEQFYGDIGRNKE